jgi:hypothetical protein
MVQNKTITESQRRVVEAQVFAVFDDWRESRPALRRPIYDETVRYA